jgi:hypothetical protein
MDPAERSKRLPVRIPPTAEIRQRVASAALSAIDHAVSTKWESARDRAARLTGRSVEDKVSRLSKLFARELGLAGAAAGGVAAAPAVGTGASLAAALAEFGYFTLRSGELILTIGALHGHTEATVEEQRAWILSVLLFGNAAAEGFTRLAGEVGIGLGKKATAKIPMSMLKSINGAANRTIVTKYGTKRGVIALGTAFPFGIGAIIGGGANYAMVALLAKHANKFFTNLPYARIVDDAVETDGAIE